MIWLTWRQLRTQAVAVSVGLAALVVLLAVTGPDLAELYRTNQEVFLVRLTVGSTRIYYAGMVLAHVFPALVGAFWGAPLLARELEAGTHRLVWNQSVTRLRWLTAKLSVTGLAVLAAAGVLTLAVSWWAVPIDSAAELSFQSPVQLPVRMEPIAFGARGIVPIGAALFAFALGVTASMLLRRTVAAMAVTLVLVAAVQVVVPVLVRPSLVPPRQDIVTITDQNISSFGSTGSDTSQKIEVAVDHHGAWLMSNEGIDGKGRVLDALPPWVSDCAPPLGEVGQPATGARKACLDRMAAEGYRQRVVYHPASDFWPMQWAETGLYLALAALLTGVCFWRVRRLS